MELVHDAAQCPLGVKVRSQICSLMTSGTQERWPPEMKGYSTTPPLPSPPTVGSSSVKSRIISALWALIFDRCEYRVTTWQRKLRKRGPKQVVQGIKKIYKAQL